MVLFRATLTSTNTYCLAKLGLSVCKFALPRRFSTTSAMPSLLEALREDWNELYKKRLPSLAKEKHASQKKWPIQLDHCFARIILDNVIGQDKPWDQVIKRPAYRHMTQEQLQDAIALGEKLANGEEDLVALDERSLALRGKRSKEQRVVVGSKPTSSGASKKRKAGPEDASQSDADTPATRKTTGRPYKRR